jgi:DNA-binding IclR family transcriptional regulator
VTTGNLNRGLAILELLATNTSGLPIHQIATKLKIPPSATHRLLSELIDYGYVRQEKEYGQYLLTMKMCSLGLAQLSQCGIVDVAQPTLDHLAQVSGEVARLAVIDGEQLIWVAKAQGAKTGLRFDPDMGGVVPLSNTATGHAWLSSMSDEAAVELVARQGGFGFAGEDVGKNSPRTVVELLRRLHDTRRLGYSILAEAVHKGIAALAASVRHTGSGQVIAVLAIAGPHTRLTDEKMEKLGPILVQAADDLAAASAGSPMLRKAIATLHASASKRDQSQPEPKTRKRAKP